MRLLTGLSTLCQSSRGEQSEEAVAVGDLEEEEEYFTDNDSLG